MKETRSTCPYCGVGCGVIIESRAGQITGVRGDPQHPANFGRLCSKGSTLHLSASPAVNQNLRLLQPQKRLVRGGSYYPLIGIVLCTWRVKPWPASCALMAQMR